MGFTPLEGGGLRVSTASEKGNVKLREGYKEKEHAFVTIEKDLKEGNIPRVVLLCGSEDYLIKWYEEALIKKYVAESAKAMDLTVLEDTAATVERIRESLETVSILSERKVVLLPDFSAG